MNNPGLSLLKTTKKRACYNIYDFEIAISKCPTSETTVFVDGGQLNLFALS